MIYLYSFLNHTSEVPAHSLSKYHWIFNWSPPQPPHGSTGPHIGHGLLLVEVPRSHSQTHTTVSRTPLDVWSAPSQRPLPDNTQHSQQTDIHTSGRIRTHNLSRRTAVDPRLRPGGHWDRQFHLHTSKEKWGKHRYVFFYAYEKNMSPHRAFILFRTDC